MHGCWYDSVGILGVDTAGSGVYVYISLCSRHGGFPLV